LAFHDNSSPPCVASTFAAPQAVSSSALSRVASPASTMPAVLLLVVAWIYVVLLMAVAEATGPGGSVLGALGIALFYGALPLAIVVYIMRAAARRRARRGAARPAAAASRDAERRGSALDPDDSGHAARDAVPPERKEP
jgi:hypothetical protein